LTAVKPRKKWFMSLQICEEGGKNSKRIKLITLEFKHVRGFECESDLFSLRFFTSTRLATETTTVFPVASLGVKVTRGSLSPGPGLTEQVSGLRVATETISTVQATGLKFKYCCQHCRQKSHGFVLLC